MRKQSLPLSNLNMDDRVPAVSLRDVTQGIIEDARTEQDKIIHLNISGTRFDVFEKTLISDAYVYDKIFEEAVWQENTETWFLERDPEVFRVVHAYLRHGELHLPKSMCGPLLEKEMDIWGLPMGLDIRRCCFGDIAASKSKLESLVSFEKAIDPEDDSISFDKSRFLFRRKASKEVWKIISKPTYSVFSKVYFLVQFFAVFLPIFVFVSGTHPYFKEDRPEFNSNLTTVSPQLYQKPVRWLITVDLVCNSILTLNLLLHIIVSPTLRNIINFYILIEVLALVPFYTEMFALNVNNPTFRTALDAAKIFVIFRMFRILIQHHAMKILHYTFRTTISDLLALVLLIAVLMLTFGSLIYMSDISITSIPMGLWWSIITMTTVGYGDIVPETVFGYVLGSLCALSGVLVIACMVPMLANKFALYYAHAEVVGQTPFFRKKAIMKMVGRRIVDQTKFAFARTKGLVTKKRYDNYNLRRVNSDL